MKKKIITTLCLYLVCVSVHSQTVLFQESFNNNSLPPGWTIDPPGVNPNTWEFAGTLNCPSVWPGNGFDNKYIGIETYSGQYYYDCSVTSATFSASTSSTAFLAYTDYFIGFVLGNDYSYRKIEVSNDNGTTWNQVLYNNISNSGITKRNVIDISSFTAGYNQVKIRFRFIAHDGGSASWALDSIVVADSIPCMSPPDSGVAFTNVPFVCTGSNAKVWIENLSRGIGQTYQWQISNSTTSSVYTNVPGATADTLNILQDGSTYYQCIVTCGGLSTNSIPLYLQEEPLLSKPVLYEGVYGLCPLQPNHNDTITLQDDLNNQPGVIYQWKYSYNSYWLNTNNGTYIPIPGATTRSVAANYATYGQPTYFICDVSCAANGANTRSWERGAFINQNTLCYCAPTNNSLCSLTNDYYSYVGIPTTNLSHNTSCVDTNHTQNQAWNGYQFFPPVTANGTTANLTRGNTYSIELIKTAYINYSSLWIDYNRNGFFENDEYHYLGLSIDTNTLYSFNFTVPLTATTGPTGMRLRGYVYNFNVDSSSACDYLVNGTTYDYIVGIEYNVGINEYNTASFSLYPNPATNFVNILMAKEENYQVELMDISGKIIYTKTETKNTTLETKKLPPGIYLVKVTTDKGSVVRKLVKQ